MLLLIIIHTSQHCAMIKWDITCVKKERKKEKVIHESDEPNCILMMLLELQMIQCPGTELAVSSRSAYVQCEGSGHMQSHETITMIKFRRGACLAAQGPSVLWTSGT